MRQIFYSSGLCILLAVTCSAILNKQDEAKNKVDNNKELQAQPSSHHSFYTGGFGDGGFGGFDGFGGHEGIGGYDDHHYGHHDHHYHHHHEGGHHGHEKSYEKALAIKGLLVPLVGAALLGVLVSNPILLQLGVISGTTYGVGRKRRSVLQNKQNSILAQTKLNDIHILERFIKQLPSTEARAQEKRLMASYLTCSGLTDTKISHTPSEFCLERLVCELQGEAAQNMPEETTVMNIVASEILENDFVPAVTKKRVAEAAKRGEKGFDCRIYKCGQMDSTVKIG